MVYQFDFQMLHKESEAAYLELFEDWELVLRFGGWYYFRKERDGIYDQIYSDVSSTRKLFLRLIGFLALVGFPLYYQTLVMYPNMTDTDGISTFKNRVVTAALAAMVGEKGQDWHVLTAGAFMSMIIPLTVFFSLQRYFVRGLMAGSVKG